MVLNGPEDGRYACEEDMRHFSISSEMNGKENRTCQAVDYHFPPHAIFIRHSYSQHAGVNYPNIQYHSYLTPSSKPTLHAICLSCARALQISWEPEEFSSIKEEDEVLCAAVFELR